MNDFEGGRQDGLKGAWNPQGDIAGQLEGQRQRDQEQAAWRNRGQGGGGQGGGSAGGLLLVFGAAALFAARFYLLWLALSVLLVAGTLLLAQRATGPQNSWWKLIRQAAATHGLALSAALMSLLAAFLLARIGLDLTPGLELFTRQGPLVMTGWSSIALPIITWLAVGGWALARPDSGLPGTGVIRWGVAILIMGGAPFVALKLAQAVFRLF